MYLNYGFVLEENEKTDVLLTIGMLTPGTDKMFAPKIALLGADYHIQRLFVSHDLAD